MTLLPRLQPNGHDLHHPEWSVAPSLIFTPGREWCGRLGDVVVYGTTEEEARFRLARRLGAIELSLLQRVKAVVS